MNYPDISRDPPRDPELGSWLADARGESAPARATERLHAAILARAQLPLARLRRQPQWWEYAAAWAKPVVPVAIAASMALGFALGSIPRPGVAPEAPTASLPALEEVLTYRMPEAEYDLLVSEAGDTDALLNFALQEVR